LAILIGNFNRNMLMDDLFDKVLEIIFKLVNGDRVHYFVLMIINGDIRRKILVRRIYFI